MHFGSSPLKVVFVNKVDLRLISTPGTRFPRGAKATTWNFFMRGILKCIKQICDELKKASSNILWRRSSKEPPRRKRLWGLNLVAASRRSRCPPLQSNYISTYIQALRFPCVDPPSAPIDQPKSSVNKPALAVKSLQFLLQLNLLRCLRFFQIGTPGDGPFFRVIKIIIVLDKMIRAVVRCRLNEVRIGIGFFGYLGQ